jgi:hypothetical protein
MKKNQKYWNIKYDHCLACKTKDKAYAGWGLCTTCYKKWQRGNKKYSKKITNYHKKYYRANKERLHQYWRDNFGPTSSPERAVYERERKRAWYYKKKYGLDTPPPYVPKKKKVNKQADN